MTKEIKRNNWSKFCRKFSSTNQYRTTRVRSTKDSKADVGMIDHFPLMGLSLEKKGRYIDGIQLFVGHGNPETVAEPILSIKEPSKVLLEQDPTGNDTKLQIQSKDGMETIVELIGERSTDIRNDLVRQVAHELYERRGHTDGNDQSDWLEAERRIEEVSLQFTQ